MTTRYARNGKGEVVHLLSCKRRGRTSMEWTYAEGMPVEWVLEQIARIPWLRGCGFCLGATANVQPEQRQAAPSDNGGAS